MRTRREDSRPSGSFGLDEDRGLVGAEQRDFADWWQEVEAEFEGLAPSVQKLTVPHRGQALVALLFDTNRRPFVVRNSVYGQRGGGAGQFEVPWREREPGSDLHGVKRFVRLARPQAHLPIVEAREAQLRVGLNTRGSNKPEGQQDIYWLLLMSLFVMPQSAEWLVLPFQPARVDVEVAGTLPREAFTRLTLSPGKGRGTSPTVEGSAHKVVLTGPGMVDVQAELEQPPGALPLDQPPPHPARVQVTLQPVGSEQPVSLESNLPPEHRKGSFYLAFWSWAAEA